MIVVAKVRLKDDEDKKAFVTKLRAYCRVRLENFKIPVKIIIDNELQHGERLKKKRL